MDSIAPKVKETFDIPGRGWKFIDPITGATFEEVLFTELVRRIYSHRTALNIPVEGLEELISRQVCAELGPRWCYCPEGFTVVDDKTRGLTADMIIASTSAALAFMANGFKWVSREEWEERAKICRKCRFNRPQNTCACSKAYEIIEKTLPRDKRDPLLGVCAACGCTLQVKTWLPKKVIQAANEKLVSANGSKNFPSWCWQLEDTEDGHN